MDFINFKMKRSDLDKEGNREKYADCAEWCNKNEHMIVENNGIFTVEKVPEPKPLTYVELRQAAYPNLAEQLDMIYWDNLNGTTHWSDTIAKVKEKYPK